MLPLEKGEEEWRRELRKKNLRQTIFYASVQNCFFEQLQPLSLSGLLLHKSFVGWSTAHKIDLKHPQMRFRVYLKAR